MTRKKIARGFVVGLFLGVILFSIAQAVSRTNSKSVLDTYINETIEISGFIKTDPDIAEGVGAIKLWRLEFAGEEIPGMIYLSGKFDNSFERGDFLTVRGKVSNGFGTYVASIFHPSVVAIAKPEPGSITLRFRNAFVKAADKTIGTPESKLGLAYLFGMRNDLDDSLLESLSLVGLTHLIVASGTHLGIIVGFFRKKFGKISRFAGALFSLVFVLVFGQLIGWTASITRASIVSVLTIFSWYYSHKLEPWRIILIAMAITLMIDPMNIIDVGWLLSFASFIGIMILEPIITEFFYGKSRPESKKTKQAPGTIMRIIIASTSAIIMCAPILLYFFGSISLIAIVANLLILPTIPVAMGLTFAAGLVGMLPSFFLFDVVKWAVGKITSILLDYHYVVIEFFSKQTSFIVSIPKYNSLVFLLYIPIVIVVAIYFINRSRNRTKAKLRVHSNPERYLPLSCGL